MEASATTNLSEITCDFVRLWDGAALQHKDVRELFVHKASVISPDLVEVQVGQETDTELIYPEPTDEQIPSLKGLLQYIDARGTGGVINKHYSLKRKHFTLQEGPLQQVQQHKAFHTHKYEQLYTNDTHMHQKHVSHLHTHKHQLHSESHHSYQKVVKKTNLTILEVFAPVLLVRQTRNVKVTRPIYIFAT
jgi:hypothetical protein